MDILYASGKATTREVGEKLPDAPTGATVRTLLKVLLKKGGCWRCFSMAFWNAPIPGCWMPGSLPPKRNWSVWKTLS